MPVKYVEGVDHHGASVRLEEIAVRGDELNRRTGDEALASSTARQKLASTRHPHILIRLPRAPTFSLESSGEFPRPL